MLSSRFAAAWTLARENLKKAQARKKKTYNRRAHEDDLRVGDRVFVYNYANCQTKPKLQVGMTVLWTLQNCGEARGECFCMTCQPTWRAPIRVSLNRVHVCPKQVSDVFWPGGSDDEAMNRAEESETNDWSSHLSCHKAGTKSHYWTPKQWMEQEIGPDQGLTWLNNRLGCVQPWLGCILLRHEYREPWSHKKNQDFLNWLQPHYPWNVH